MIANLNGSHGRPDNEKPGRNEQFDSVGALRNPGFAMFLGRFPRALDVTKDVDRMRERFEVFEIKEKLIEDVKDVYKNELAETGIVLDPKDLECVDLYISETAIESPETLLEMNQNITDYRAYPEQVERATNDVEASVKGAKGLGLLGKAKMYAQMALNMVNPEWGQEGLVINQAKNYIDSKGIPSGFEGMKLRLARLRESGDDERKRFTEIKDKSAEELAQLEKSFAELKENMFAGMSFHGEISRTLKQKVKEHILAIAEDLSQDNTRRAFERKDEIKGQEIFGAELITDQGDAQIERALDTQAIKDVEKRIGIAIKELKPATAQDPYAELENSLIDVTSLGELGSNDRKETREIVLDLLEESAKSLPRNQEGKAKKILIKTFIRQLEQEA